MTIIKKIIDKLAALLLIVNRNERIPLGKLTHIDRADHERHRELLELLLRMAAEAAEKYNTLETLLFLELNRNIDLILKLLDVLKHERIFFLINLPLKYLNHLCKERVADALDQDSDRPGIRALEIARTVVRHIIVLPDRIHDLLLRLFIDIRMVIDRSGNSAHTYTTQLCHFFNRNLFHAL